MSVINTSAKQLFTDLVLRRMGIMCNITQKNTVVFDGSAPSKAAHWVGILNY